MPAQGHRALAQPAALPPARATARAARTASAPGVRFRSPHPPGQRAHRRHASTTPGPPTHWSGRCSTVVDASAGEAWCAALQPASRPRAAGRGRRPATRSALLGGAAAGRAVRVVRRPASRPPRRLGDGPRPTAPARRSPTDLAWQPELWRRIVAAVGEPSPVRATPRDHLPAAGRDPESLDLPARFSLFGHTRIPVDRGRAARRPRASTATCTSGCRIPPTRCGRRSPNCRRRAPREDESARAGRPPVARFPRPGPARAAAHAEHGGRAGDPATGTSARASPERPCSPGCRPTSPPTPPTDPTRRVVAAATSASRCTPATDRPDRWRCCARCCSACSPTTRRSSRATSW